MTNVKQIDGSVQNETASKNREHLSMALSMQVCISERNLKKKKKNSWSQKG